MTWKCQIVIQNTTMAMVHMMGKTSIIFLNKFENSKVQKKLKKIKFH